MLFLWGNALVCWFLNSYVGLYNLDAVPEAFDQASYTDFMDWEREFGGGWSGTDVHHQTGEKEAGQWSGTHSIWGNPWSCQWSR